MKKLSIEFDEVDLRDHPELADEFKKQGLLSAPVVVAGSKTWAGFKFDKIHALANRPKEVKNESAPFNCHGIEWEAGQSCLGCDAVTEYREAMAAGLEAKIIVGNVLSPEGLPEADQLFNGVIRLVVDLLKKDPIKGDNK
jgi:hypothetical protein